MTPNSPGLEVTSSSQCLASVLGDMELPWTFCCSPRPIEHMKMRGTALHTLPIATQPSIPSFLFSSFIPFAFFLPHPAPPHLLVPVKGKSLCSRGFLERNTSCGHLAGGRRTDIQQVTGGLEGVGLHPGQHLPLGWLVLGSAASRAGHVGQVMRPPLIPWLSL